MQEILSLFLILTVIIKVTDFSRLQIIDYIILMLFAANAAMSIYVSVKSKSKKGGN